MTTRALSDHEVFDLLDRHPDAAGAVQDQETLYLAPGHPWTWDQILASQKDDETLYPIPPRGLHVNDEVYGDVVIYPDAHGFLHFIVTDNASLLQEVDKPVYSSDPDYFGLLSDWLKTHVPTVPQIEFSLGSAAVVAVVVLVLLGGRH